MQEETQHMLKKLVVKCTTPGLIIMVIFVSMILIVAEIRDTFVSTVRVIYIFNLHVKLD
jgi:hypothetical protein